MAALLSVSIAAAGSLGIGSVWYNARLHDEVERTKLQQVRAAASLQTAIDVLDQQLTELYKANLLGNYVPEPVRQTLLEHAVQFYQKLLAEADDPDPLVRRAIGRAYNGLATSYHRLHDRDRAVAPFDSALAVQKKLQADFPDQVDYAIDRAFTEINRYFLFLQWQPAARKEEADIALAEAVALVAPLSPDHPRVGEFAIYVAQKLWGEGKMAESIPWLDRHIREIEARLAKAQPGTSREMLQAILHPMYVVRAQLFAALGDNRQALSSWDRVLAMGEIPDVHHRPGYCRLQRARILLRLGDHVRALAEAKALAEAERVEENTFYITACILSLASGKAGQDESLSSAERIRLAEDYAARAVELLQQARATCYFKDLARVEHLKNDSDLAPLRGRKDFKGLLAELQTQAGTK